MGTVLQNTYYEDWDKFWSFEACFNGQRAPEP